MLTIKESDSGCFLLHKNRLFATCNKLVASDDLDKSLRGFTSADLTWPSRCGAIVGRLEALGQDVKPNFHKVSQVYLDICVWPLWQKHSQGRKFWAMRLLIDDIVPTQVENWLRVHQHKLQKPLFDDYSVLETFCTHVQDCKEKHRWIHRWTIHLNVSSVVSFLKEVDTTFPGHSLIVFLLNATNQSKTWDETIKDLQIEEAPCPLRPKESAQVS